MIQAPRMLMIGSAGRNSGKTVFACRLIQKLRERHKIIAAKVTTVHQHADECPRGGKGCGACTSFGGSYCLTQEDEARGGKDTQHMLAAGANAVYWLRTVEAGLEAGAAALIETIGPEAMMICESNSLRTVVEPAAFLMFRHKDATEFKPTAEAVRQHADRIVVFDGTALDMDPVDVAVVDRQWAIRLPATAIILAGGKSERMGRDKSMLPVGGKPMIERLRDQLDPHFQQILISANDARRFAFLGLNVVPDRMTGEGPLAGIAAALEASRNDRNLVVACDIPAVNLHVVRTMLREAADYDAVVPTTGEDRLEPLFAVYRKSMIGAIVAALEQGERRIRNAFVGRRVKYCALGKSPWLENINTIEEYNGFVSRFSSEEQHS